MGLLTKVVKGVAFGDVSNQAVRNILTEISKSLKGNFTEQEMEDTLDYFNWECPYTGRDLRNSIANKDGTYATDHIEPQNREGCGLNVKGNLIIVDKRANSAKRGLSIEKFMEDDSDFWTKLGIDKATRMDRLKKIKAFQKDCGYDPDRIRLVVHKLMEDHYDHIRKEQEKCIEDTLNALKTIHLFSVATPAPTTTTATTIPATAKKAKTHSYQPDLIFHPADEEEFKKELLKSKKAHFELTYDTGVTKTSPWNAAKFSSTSNLRGNIESKAFWREKDKEGLVKVEVFID